MRDIRKGNCPLCNHHEIVQSAPVDFAYGAMYQLAVTHEVSKTTKQAQPNQPVGRLNLFVCRRCGFSQWFAFDPEQIPIGDEYGTRLLTGFETKGPYR